MGEDEKNPIKQLGNISEQVLNGIVQSIEAAVVVHDRRLKVVFINASFKTIYEIDEENVIGRSPMDFLPDSEESQKKAILSRLQKTLRTGVKSPYHEFSYCSQSGKFRHLVGISIPIFDSSHEITHVMSVIHDLTRRKELEQEAVKAAKLSSIADMAYTLAHEINNPLMGIKLGLSSLYDSLKKEENIQTLDSVMKDLKRIQEIVNAFLRAKKNPSFLKKEKISIIGEILEDVLFHLSGKLDRQNISIDKRLSGEDHDILIDRDGIYRVFLNLFLNAIQAMPEKGRLTISTGVTTSGERGERPRDLLCISLADTGSGIDPKHSKEIFEPFYSSKPEGTGLGLSICKEIVSAHHGFMKVEGDVGKGTTVNIYLPIVKSLGN